MNARWLLIAILIFSLMLPVLSHGEGENPARELLSRITMGWSLGNTLDADTVTLVGNNSETSWGNPKVTPELIDAVANMGFNAIRIPVTWFNHMNMTTHEIDEAWMNRVQEIVDMVLDRGLICILNMHHDTGTGGWLKTVESSWEHNKTVFTDLWRQIALRSGITDLICSLRASMRC